MSIKPVAAFRANLRACWITTYNLDLGLYDSFLFSRLGDPPLNAVVLADGPRLDQTLQAVPADEQWRLQRANRRWLLRGARPDGAFHPKTILLADKASARLLVGSGNLSLSGLDVGYETFTEFTTEDPQGAAAMAAWVNWMNRIVQQQDDDVLSGRFTRLVADLPTSVDVVPEGMLHNLDAPLLDQFLDAAPDAAADQLHLAAPYYDHNLSAVQSLLDRLRPRTVTVYLAERTSVDGLQLRNLLAEGGVEFELRRYLDDGRNPVAFVHAKLIGVSFVDGTALLLAGSPNLSRAAMLATAGVEPYANVEAASLTALTANTLAERFTNPPSLATEPIPADAVERLTFDHDQEPPPPLVRLLRAIRNPDSSVNLVADRPIDEGWLITDGERIGRPGQTALEGRLVWLVDEHTAVLSNRVVVDEPAELQGQLEDRGSRDNGRPRELRVTDLDHPLGAVLNYLQQTCIMDVAETRAVQVAERATDTEDEASAEFWERLAREELRRDPRISTYDRLRGRTPGLTDPLANLLAAMLARTPPEARTAVTNVIAFPTSPEKPQEEDDGDGALRSSWSTSARIRVRARNVLRRWADAVGDERLQWIDPLAPLTNFRALIDALAWLYFIHHITDEGAVLTEDDIDEVFRRLVDAGLSPLGAVDHVVSHLPDRTLPLVAALLYLAVRTGPGLRSRTLDWQPRLQALLDLDLISPTDLTAAYLGEVLGMQITPDAVLDALLDAIDYIDDEEWCRRTADGLDLTSLELEIPGKGQDLDVRVRVGGIDAPLRDPVTIRLLSELQDYREATSVAVFDAKGRWRLAIDPGEAVAFKAEWLDEAFVESREVLTSGQLHDLFAAGGSLADLFAPEHRAAS